MQNPFEVIESRLSNLENLLLLLTKKPVEIHPKFEKEYLTRKETAELLNVNLVTLWNYTNDGLLTSYKIGTRVLYKATDVREAILKSKTETVVKA